jgi:hypothetical protein
VIYLRLALALVGVLALLMGLVITYRVATLFRAQRERVPSGVWVLFFERGLSIVAFGLLFLAASIVDASVAPYLIGAAGVIVFAETVLRAFGFRFYGASV